MAGELISAAGQIEWNGLLFGGPTADYHFGGDVEGLADIPDVERGDQPRARAHGLVRGPIVSRERYITVQLRFIGVAYLAEKIAALNAATTLANSESPLVWDFGDGARRSNVRIIRRSIPTVPMDMIQGVADATLQFVATDPRIYGNTEQSGSTSPGSVTGGLSFPHGFPHGFGTATAGTIQVDNNGTIPAPWTATLTGPLVSPRVTTLDGEGNLHFNGFTLADGETLEIGSLNRTVLLGGTASRYNALTTRTWFDLPVGPSSVQLSAASGTGSLELRWRDTYL